MRITHNIAALNTQRNLNINTTSANKSMEKLSSGYRINRAADDAAGLSISENMRGQIRGLEQAARNTQDGISFAQTAEGAMDEVSEMLSRMKELSVQRSNGTYSSTDQDNIDLELDELTAQIDKIMTKTAFNGISITKSINIVIDDLGTTLSFAGIDTSKFMSLGGTSSLGKINDAIEAVSTERAKIGAKQNRLEYTYNNLNTTTENITAAESNIRDTDIASEMVKLTKDQVLLQASQSMLSQANSSTQGALTLLQ